MPHHRYVSTGSIASSAVSRIIETTPQHEHPKSHFSWCNSAHCDSTSSLGHPPHDATTQITHTPTSNRTPHYPHTPPPLDHWRSPYTTIPLPSDDEQIYLNAILRRARFPSIIWNILSHVYGAHCSAHTAHWRDAWASTPAQRSLAIRSSLIDRPILVFSGAQTFVTVGDVLEAISRAIRQMDRGRSSLFEEQIVGDAVRPAEPRLSIGLGMADHQDGNSDQGGGAHAYTGDHARAIMWGGLIESPTERQVWILCVN